jgi:uncharacterized protein YbjT (DUF2867 family)
LLAAAVTVTPAALNPKKERTMIVLTGATGTVGSLVSEQLSEAGIKHRVIARNPDKAKKQPTVEVVEGHYEDKAAVESALKGATKVFLLTNSVPESVQWQKNVIDAAKKNGVQHVVRVSVQAADKSSPVKIAQWHAMTDEYLKANVPQWTLLQPTYFMTNFLGSASTIKKDGAFYGAAKNGKIATIDPRDIAAVAVKALTSDGHAGKTYVLTGKEGWSMAQIAEKIGKPIGKTVKYVDVPPEQFKAGLVSAGLADWYAQDFATMHEFIAQGGMATVDPTVGQLLGKVRTFDDFLQRWGGGFR